jgi:DNA segregation ATPase FtsK/SpoIIIE, S-DNA-T family
MTVASQSKSKPSPRAKAKLSPEKGQELVGLLLGTVGALLGLALGSYQAADPSFLHQVPRGAGGGVGNWIGPVGAEVADFGLALLGLTAFLVPALLLAAAWKRLGRRGAARVVGRGFGVVLVLASAPGLVQLALGRLAWRGGEMEAGGAFGEVIVDLLTSRLNVPGALLVLLAAVIVGSTLAVQSTLGEILAAWKLRLVQLVDRVRLARARRADRRQKERQRRRVVEKHLARRVEERREEEAGAAAAPARLDLPLRVVERAGAGGFAVRRVRGAEAAERFDEAAAAPPARRRGADLDLPRAAERPTAPRAAREPAAAPRAPVSAVPQSELFEPGSGPLQADLPPMNLLQMGGAESRYDENELVRLGEVIRSRCAEFGVEGTIDGINPGPVITVYEFQPAPGVKVAQIVNLQDDLALALKAESVRIDRIPGRSTLGIEVPNRERSMIKLGDLLADKRFEKSPSLLTLALGRDIRGEPVYGDLTTMPHLLIAGATGAGKSVGLQAMITSILYKARKDEVKFIFIDPKRIELGVYADVPHLAAEVVVDPKKAAYALARMVKEMEDRYRLLAEVHVRSIAYYNRAIRDPEVRRRLSLNEGESDVALDDLKPLPYYVIIIDELADLMMVASNDVETAIARLAQMARAVGIHLIVATQRPSVDVLTGTIKANFPCRISFATASRHDSRTILDQVGSEKLLGKGDMLYMPPGTSRIQRLHGAYVSEQETAGLVRWLKRHQGAPDYDPRLLEPLENDRGAGGDGEDSDDDLYDEAARLVVSEGMGSASFLQRRLRVGFSRASRLIDLMERDGILGPPQGSKPREVLVAADYFEEIERARQGV